MEIVSLRYGMPGGAIFIFTVDFLLSLLVCVQRELMLFSACGLIIGGIDELLIDIVYVSRNIWRRLTIYTRFDAMTTATLPSSDHQGRVAVFVPAWHEADVIGSMLWTALQKWGHQNYIIFVGTYPNDRDTIEQVSVLTDRDSRVGLVVNPCDGPTTKADCLNTIWRAMLDEERRTGTLFKAVILHDAEDVVHPDELRVFDRLIDRFDMVQLPVLPLVSQQSQWVSGHYGDEFAEAHIKNLVVREALGAAVPSAGVGCALRRDALIMLATEQDGRPFDPLSLTEDYEIGLRLMERGRRGVFVRMNDATGKPVCSRGHFPETLSGAVRQKARWTVGISLAGWDRLGWSGSFVERWMRLRDRAAALSALILFAAYLSGVLWILLWAVEQSGAQMLVPTPPLLTKMLTLTAILMLWRVIVRSLFVGYAYGWRQALLSIPRTAIANVIAILAARRALAVYFGLLRGTPLLWDKTQHRFPVGSLQETR